MGIPVSNRYAGAANVLICTCFDAVSLRLHGAIQDSRHILVLVPCDHAHSEDAILNGARGQMVQYGMIRRWKNTVIIDQCGGCIELDLVTGHRSIEDDLLELPWELGRVGQ